METLDLNIFYDPTMYEPGCKQPGPLFPVIVEFIAFQSRCAALGFGRDDVLKLVKGLAERDLKGSADVE